MSKVNWKIVNAAFWIEIVLSYVIPFKVVENSQYRVGVPYSFITVYNNALGVNPLMSMHLNPVALLVNVAALYWVVSLTLKAYQKHKPVPEN